MPERPPDATGGFNIQYSRIFIVNNSRTFPDHPDNDQRVLRIVNAGAVPAICEALLRNPTEDMLEAACTAIQGLI